MNSVKVWAAFTVGVLSGACVALLYAPQSGERTRRQIRRNVEDAGDYLRETAEEVQGRAQEYVKRGRDVVDDLVESARKTVKA
jgi:gas vesicle protein